MRDPGQVFAGAHDVHDRLRRLGRGGSGGLGDKLKSLAGVDPVRIDERVERHQLGHAYSVTERDLAERVALPHDHDAVGGSGGHDDRADRQQRDQRGDADEGHGTVRLHAGDDSSGRAK